MSVLNTIVLWTIFRLLIHFRHVAHMPRVKLGNLPCFEETPGGPFDEWVWALPRRCNASREPLLRLENSELKLTEEGIEGRGLKTAQNVGNPGGGRVERGNMGLNKQEIFALCLVHMDWGADLHHTPMQIVWIDDWNCLELGNNIFVCFFCVWPNYCQITTMEFNCVGFGRTKYKGAPSRDQQLSSVFINYGSSSSSSSSPC